MDIASRPELVDRLAAAYALGTLRGPARRRFEQLARQSPAVRTAALLWQERLASVTELQPPERPDPNVWKRIENLIVAQRLPQPAPGPAAQTARGAAWWRGAAFASIAVAVAALAGIVGLSYEDRREIAQLSARPDVQYVAVLSDQNAAASVLVTLDPVRGTLTLKRVGGYREGDEKSLQLWALPAAGAPRSLGVMERGAVTQVPSSEADLRQVPALAVTLEPKGGVPAGHGPTGPVLFKGALLPTS